MRAILRQYKYHSPEAGAYCSFICWRLPTTATTWVYR